jgi:hypothetical protein
VAGRLAVLVVALAASGVLAEAALAGQDFVYFKSPSGNIRCAWASADVVAPGGSVRCDVLRTSAGRTVALELPARGQARKYEPTDVAAGPNQRALPYGSTFRRGPFRCKSQRKGITCRSTASGHGFFASRQTQRLF